MVEFSLANVVDDAYQISLEIANAPSFSLGQFGCNSMEWDEGSGQYQIL